MDNTLVNSIDLETFCARAETLIGPHCERFDFPSRWNKANLGAAFISKEERAARPDHFVIDLGVKTGRTWAHGYDEDALGVESPKPELVESIAALASEFGLKASAFEANEKGWGSFYFEAAQ